MVNVQPVGVAFVDTFGVNASNSIRAIDKGIKQITEKKKQTTTSFGQRHEKRTTEFCLCQNKDAD